MKLEVLPPVDRRAEALHLVEVGEFRVTLVDRRQVVVGLQTRKMEVALLVELRHEPVGAGPVGVELTVAEGGLGHVSRIRIR